MPGERSSVSSGLENRALPLAFVESFRSWVASLPHHGPDGPGYTGAFGLAECRMVIAWVNINAFGFVECRTPKLNYNILHKYTCLMASAVYKAQLMEERLSIAVLLTLAEEKEPIVKGVLASKIARSAGTVIDRVNELLEAGLVTESKEETRPFRKFVELTPRGRTVAEHLAAIEEILEEK